MMRDVLEPRMPGWLPRTSDLHVAYLASYLPRKCGIATFTSDLVAAIDRAEPLHVPHIYAMQEREATVEYSDVAMVLEPEDLASYVAAAEDINASPVQALNIQHEYGLFGGRWGRMLLGLMLRVEKPIITTLHTVLPSPDDELRGITRDLCDCSSAVVVLSRQAVEMLDDEYGVDRGKVHVIPHGVPAVPREGQEPHKRRLGLASRSVLATFGLINADKGIEYALDAMPSIVAQHPDVLYLVLGETHPGVRRSSGESYRTKLLDRVRELGLEDHVRFSNQFLTNPELVEYLMATDILLVLNQNLEQYVSGTLAYAVGCGRAIIATPFRYAQELLANGRGILVGQRDPEGIARGVNTILGLPWYKEELERLTYEYGRRMQWPAVAEAYLELTRQVTAPTLVPPEPIEALGPVPALAGDPFGLGVDDELLGVKR